MSQPFSRQRYNEVWDEVADIIKSTSDAPQQIPYMQDHKFRFFELFEHMAMYLDGIEKPRVLEFGTSSYTIFIKKLFPNVELFTADRPVEFHGYPPEFALQRAGSAGHYQVNHNTTQIGPDYGEPPIGQFDYVLFCEIFEHLVTHPVELLEELVSLLKPDGLLYLTTPNFFSLGNLLKMERREHPGQLYRRRGEDEQAASMHVREYTMGELVQFSEDAGGKVIRAVYSGAFNSEHEDEKLRKTPEFYSNLVILVAPKDTQRDPDTIMSYTRHGKVSEEYRQEGEKSAAELLLENERLKFDNGLLKDEIEAFKNGRLMRTLNWLRSVGIPIPD
ncbi:MAG: methyltransferase domain-containing protein [Chloroflexota bacterium]